MEYSTPGQPVGQRAGARPNHARACHFVSISSSWIRASIDRFAMHWRMPLRPVRSERGVELCLRGGTNLSKAVRASWARNSSHDALQETASRPSRSGRVFALPPPTFPSCNGLQRPPRENHWDALLPAAPTQVRGAEPKRRRAWR